jgi:mannose-6-phosphate isomerase
MDPDPLALASSASGHDRSERPWGWFETLAEGEGYRVKRLRLHAGRRISLQRHRHRCEHWVVVAGEGTIECDDRQLAAAVGTTVFIPVGGLHRASAGAEALEIIEVQRGCLLSEEDIERFDDDYGRVVTSFNSL